MKNVMKNIFVFLISFAFSLNLSANCYQNEPNSQKRKSITFILGEDESMKDQYYELAKKYHLLNKAEKTDYFIDDCRSLIAVRDYLEKIANENNIKWGTINIVVHSNQWTGMSVPISTKGERTNVDALLNSIFDGSFIPVADQYLDSNSTMNIKACGLGQNIDLMDALQMAFGGMDNEQPMIHSSSFFIQYFENEYGEIESKELEPFYAFYKTAYKPADLHIEKQFQKRYPNEKIDWLAILSNQQSEIDGIFSKKFNVPIEWEVILPKDEKDNDFKSEKDKLAFVKQQADLMELLNRFNIPIEKFRWNITSKLRDSGVVLKINGKATVVCVLRG